MQACRIAGVLTLWDNLDASNVGVREMELGITLAGFYMGEALRLANAAVITAKIERAETLHQWLLETREHAEIMPSEVVRHAPIRGLRESSNAKAALEVLEKHGWLVTQDAGTEVRGTIRKLAYQIVKPRT